MKLHFAPVLRIAAVVAGTVLGSQSAFAGVTATIEAAGVQASTASNIITETFNADHLTAGSYTTINSIIGTYQAAPNSVIKAADQYGGAATNSQYLVLGGPAGAAGSVTLTLNGPADYFGMWWSAVDASNQLDFYSGGVNVGSFGRSSILALINALPVGDRAAYYGNPNPPAGRNVDEPYAYVNFTGATFDTIVFSNGGSTGFETDNHSVHAVPEPSALLMGGAASLIGLAVARRRGRKA